MKQGRRAERFILPHRWISVIWRMTNWRQSTKKTKVELTPRRQCERWFRILCSNHRTRIISITNDGSKGHGYHIQTAKVRRTSSWRNICSYSGQNGRCSKIIENSKVGMSKHLDSYTSKQMTYIMVQYGRPSRSSWTKSVRSSFDKTVMGKAIWENPIEKWVAESFQLECLFVHREKGLFLSVYVNDIRNKTLIRCRKYNTQRSWFGRTNIIPRSCKLWMYSKTVWNKQRYCWQRQNHVWIRNFRRSNWKITMLGKSACFFVVLWHGRSCKEMCGATLWVGKQDDSTTLQWINPMHRWQSL